jgi:hypothetical protein
MDVRIEDEALFVIPGSGALWSYDFGRTKRVIREGGDPVLGSDPPFQIAQTRAGEHGLLLVLPTFGAPSIAQQHRIRTLLGDWVGIRNIAFVLDEGPGRVSVVASDLDLVEPVAAAAAVVRTCWGWDPARALRIQVDELEFRVAPEFDGEVWTAKPELIREPRSRRGSGRASRRRAGSRSPGPASGGGARGR